MNLKTLVKDTAIYGLSSIVGRFLNYLLIILYSYTIPAESGGYGIVTNLYAWTALLLAILTFGMETTFFRFAGKQEENSETVYAISLKMVGGVSLCFLVLVFAFLGPIASMLGYSSHPEYIACFALITALDAFQAIMFSRLRQQKKAIKFVSLKLSFIFLSIILNVFLFLGLPKLFPSFPGLEAAFNYMDYGVGFIFFINLFCTSVVTFGFVNELKGLKTPFDKQLCLRMLRYTWPLLLLSLVGILNQVADKILFPYLMPGPEGKVQLGIYGACVKIAMIMAMLTQAFRYAYEPIVFGSVKDKDNKQTLSQGMKYFICFTLLAYLAVMFYLPLLKFMVGRSYWAGLGVVPVVMAAEIFMGVYFNLSFWYKITDQTWWGAVFSFIGSAVMIAINVIFVPRYGYWACAWGGFAGYGIAMILSFAIGSRKYPVAYDYKSITAFVLLAAVLFLIYEFMQRFTSNTWILVGFGTILLLVYAFFLFVDIRRSQSK